jgi:hypothetical protein
MLRLSRFLNFSNPSRSLATEDPAFEDFLPVDDNQFYDSVRKSPFCSGFARWLASSDNAVSQTTSPSDAVPISQAFSLKVGQFSRLCQATYIVSQALTIMRSPQVFPQGSSDTGVPQETEQLCRTLEALVRASEVEITIRKLAFCSQSVVSYR